MPAPPPASSMSAAGINPSIWPLTLLTCVRTSRAASTMPLIRGTASAFPRLHGFCMTFAACPGHFSTSRSILLSARTCSKMCVIQSLFAESCVELATPGIETPSRIREIFAKERFFTLKSLTGNVPEIGFHHHRWFVEAEGPNLRFTAKTTALSENRKHYVTRGDIGRKLSEQESALALFWIGEFTSEEVFTDLRTDYLSFRRKAMDMLKT